MTGCAKAPPADAAAVFALRCATCHGPTGRGDGPAARRLGARPRDLADPAWQDARSDAQIAAVILNGGAMSGRSELMPPHPDLAPRVAELVGWLRGLARRRAGSAQ